MKILISALLTVSTLFSTVAVPYAASAQSREIIVRDGFDGPRRPRPDFDRDFDRDYDRRPHQHRGNDKHHDRDLAIGIIGGLAAGAIIGGAIVDEPRYQQPRPPRFEPRPYPHYYPPRRQRPVPEYRGDADLIFQPWSRQWRDFCSNRYRTFNPGTGTYLGGDGKWHFCVVR